MNNDNDDLIFYDDTFEHDYDFFPSDYIEKPKTNYWRKVLIKCILFLIYWLMNYIIIILLIDKILSHCSCVVNF